MPSEEKKKTWVDGVASESETAKQPVSLFSPLRGGMIKIDEIVTVLDVI